MLSLPTQRLSLPLLLLPCPCLCADPLPTQSSTRGGAGGGRGPRSSSSQRRPRTLPSYSTLPGGRLVTTRGFGTTIRRHCSSLLFLAACVPCPLATTCHPPCLPTFALCPACCACRACLAEPSVEQIEAEFWRIVESPEEVVESLYGQDVDSGHHGSGFPLPLWRRRLLEQHLARQAAAAGGGGAVELPNYTTGEA